jgi:hypothetical protein
MRTRCSWLRVAVGTGHHRTGGLNVFSDTDIGHLGRLSVGAGPGDGIARRDKIDCSGRPNSIVILFPDPARSRPEQLPFIVNTSLLPIIPGLPPAQSSIAV